MSWSPGQHPQQTSAPAWEEAVGTFSLLFLCVVDLSLHNDSGETNT